MIVCQAIRISPNSHKPTISVEPNSKSEFCCYTLMRVNLVFVERPFDFADRLYSLSQPASDFGHEAKSTFRSEREREEMCACMYVSNSSSRANLWLPKFTQREHRFERALSKQTGT